MTNSNGLKFFIFVPAKLGRLERCAKYQQTMKCCPACGGTLVLFHEKFGELNGDFRARLGSTGSGSGRGSSGGGGPEPRPWNPPQKGAPPVNALHGGWYCSTCGVHIMPEQMPHSAGSRSAKHASRSMEDLKNAPKYAESNSSNSSFKGKVVDEHFEELAGHFHQSFLTLMSHVREHFLLKEAQLKEYQVDLCQRERILRSNEEYTDQRFGNLKSAEDVIASKTERLHIYKNSMLAQLDMRAQQLARYETSLREWREQMIRELHPLRQEVVANKAEVHHAYRPEAGGDYTQGTASNPEYMNHQMIPQGQYKTEAYQPHGDLNQTAPVQPAQSHPALRKPRSRSVGGAVDEQRESRRTERQSWYDHEQQATGAAQPEGNPALRGSRTDLNSHGNPALRGSRTDLNHHGNPALRGSRTDLSHHGNPALRGSRSDLNHHENQALRDSRTDLNHHSNPALRDSRADLNHRGNPALPASRADPSHQGLAAKPPLPAQRFGPIYQYRSLSRDQFQPRHRESSAERRSLEQPLSPHKDDNNNLDSPSSKPSADRDSGYTSTSVSMNRSDSPDRLHPAADLPGGFDSRADQPRRSYFVGEVDPEKTKPLRVYTTANIKPDVRPVSYPAGLQGHHYSAQLPPADGKDNPHGPWQRSAPAPATIVPAPAGPTPAHRGWSQPRTWLEGPRRVTEL